MKPLNPSFGDLDDYTFAHKCPTCAAPPWTDCAAPNKAGERNRAHRQHKTRQHRGADHYWSDLGNAPWAEDRVPGEDYSTIDRPTGWSTES